MPRERFCVFAATSLFQWDFACDVHFVSCSCVQLSNSMPRGALNCSLLILSFSPALLILFNSVDSLSLLVDTLCHGPPIVTLCTLFLRIYIHGSPQRCSLFPALYCISPLSSSVVHVVRFFHCPPISSTLVHYLPLSSTHIHSLPPTSTLSTPGSLPALLQVTSRAVWLAPNFQNVARASRGSAGEAHGAPGSEKGRRGKKGEGKGDA